MASISRLTFASVWGFEQTGVTELENEFEKTGAIGDCHGDYSKTDDVLVLKGYMDGSLSKVAAIIEQYIDEQQSKDLLDVPRVFQLDVPAVLHDPLPVPSLETNDTKAPEGDLLALGGPQDEDLLLHSRSTKGWVSPDGGAGYFLQFPGILMDIAILTGTEISVSEDAKAIQVSGNNESDANDALAKISRVYGPLNLAYTPTVENLAISSSEGSTRFKMQYYSNLNQAAKRRILTDPGLDPSPALYQSFVTVSLAFDQESQTFKLPVNLLDPPRIGDGPGGASRIWADFNFPAFGRGDMFNVETIVDQAHSETKSCLVEESPSHRYLSAAKAMQVDKWVNERAEIEQTELVSQPPSMPPPETTYELTSAPNPMKPAGIKSRRAVTSVKKQSASPAKSAASKSQSPNAPGDDKSQSPRKKWRMNYTSQALDKSLSRPAKDTGKNEGSALGNVASNTTDTSTRGFPSNFDATKYTKNKSIPIPAIKPRVNPSLRANNTLSTSENRKGQRSSQLIDTSVSTCTTNMPTLPRLSLSQPALIPETLSGGTIPNHDLSKNVISCETSHSINLSGLNFETDGSFSPGTESVPSSGKAVSSSTDTEEQEKRLDRLKKTLQDQDETDHFDVIAFTVHRPRSRRHANQVYGKEKLEELDRIHKSEMAQITDEVATREYHLTMKQKAGNPIGKVKVKAEVKAKRQATLEDAWGMLRKPIKNIDSTAGFEKASEKSANGDKESETKQEMPKSQRLQADEMRTNEDIKHLYGALKQTLEAAEYFPGTLTLSLQFGLLLIPLLPKTFQDQLISLDEWKRIFQPQTGVTPPTTKFINRLTTSGSDVDHIVDLKTSKAEGKRRIFEQDDSEFCVYYEYHCRTKSDKPIIITVNDQGKHTLRHPASALGGANLHFPGQTWDAHLGVSGDFLYRDGSDPEFEEAARYLVDHIWVPPNKSHVQIFTQLPEGNKVVIDKVLMKRWSRHRHIRADDPSPTDVANPDRISSKGLGARSANSPDPLETASQDSRNRGAEANSDQDIFLQVTEVQNLMIGVSAADSRAVRARCAPLLSMLKTGRQWYEVSLVSPAIEALLKSNANLEIGERTDDWRAADLFGKDATLIYDELAGCSETQVAVPFSPVASAIGDAGIGSLLRLAKKVIGKMDGVGYWNYNPQADADLARMSHTSSFGSPPMPTAPIVPTSLTVASLKNHTAKPEPKSFSFEELESIKGPGSATMDVALTKKSSPIPSSKPMEEAEKDYW